MSKEAIKVIRALQKENAELIHKLKLIDNSRRLRLQRADNLEVKNQELVKALKKSVEVIKQWHGNDVFDIYFNQSPEMESIRKALKSNN